MTNEPPAVSTSAPADRIARWEAAAHAAGREVDRNALAVYMAVADAEQAKLAHEHAERLDHIGGALARIRDNAEVVQVRVRRVLAFAEQVVATSGPGPAGAVRAVVDRLSAAVEEQPGADPSHLAGEARDERETQQPETATLAAALDGLHHLIATSSRDWGRYRADAWLWAVLCGWDCEQDEHDETCTHGALEELAQLHGWDGETVAKARRYRAAVRAVTDTAVVAQQPEAAEGAQQ
jgi:hypothetical protein